MKRVFLGFDLSKEIKTDIEQLKLRHRLDKLPIKLVEPKNSHIAVKFLGQLDDLQIKQVIKAVESTTKNNGQLQATIGNGIMFPNNYSPRVLALTITGHDLIDFAKRIILALNQLPFITKEDRKFTPYITLGRIKEELKKSEIKKLQRIEYKQLTSFNRLQLFESQLSSAGPVYTALNNFDL